MLVDKLTGEVIRPLIEGWDYPIPAA